MGANSAACAPVGARRTTTATPACRATSNELGKEEHWGPASVSARPCPSRRSPNRRSAVNAHTLLLYTRPVVSLRSCGVRDITTRGRGTGHFAVKEGRTHNAAAEQLHQSSGTVREIRLAWRGIAAAPATLDEEEDQAVPARSNTDPYLEIPLPTPQAGNELEVLPVAQRGTAYHRAAFSAAMKSPKDAPDAATTLTDAGSGDRKSDLLQLHLASDRVKRSSQT